MSYQIIRNILWGGRQRASRTGVSGWKARLGRLCGVESEETWKTKWRGERRFAHGMSFRRPFFFLLLDSLVELVDWDDAGESPDALATCVVLPVAVLSAAWVAVSLAETGCVPSDPATG